MLLAFIGWLMSVRGVSSVSISKYLLGLRTVHLKNGVLPGNLRPDIVSYILRGKSNEESMGEKKAPRLAMTLPVMKLLKALLVKTRMPHDKRRLIWAVGCLGPSAFTNCCLGRSTASTPPPLCWVVMSASRQ